jgi:hypothetical protein
MSKTDSFLKLSENTRDSMNSEFSKSDIIYTPSDNSSLKSMEIPKSRRSSKSTLSDYFRNVKKPQDDDDSDLYTLAF